MNALKALTLIFIFKSASGFLFNLEEPLHVGSFNIESLGVTKISKPEIVGYIVRILTKFDIVAIQEIKDSSTDNEAVFKVLMEEVNKAAADQGFKYDYVISERLGDGTYKEQKAFIFRNSLSEDGSRKIKITGTHVYADPKNVYDRPPYVAKFQIENTDLPVKGFSFINLHLKPYNVFNESMELRPVVDEIFATGNDNILITGDMNFDCRYMPAYKKEIVREELKEFQFYINDDTSTTTSSALCALDRILISGEAFKNSVVPNSNGTYLYYEEFGISREKADEVSDHFPVQIKFSDGKRITKEVPLILGSFNIEQFGPTKVSRPEFLESLVQILADYDIVLIQEIRDSSEDNSVFKEAMAALNDYVSSFGVKYDFIISPRLGSSQRNMEQSAFLYRNSIVSTGNREIKVLKQYIYNDVDNVYERSPFVANFQIKNTNLPISDFYMINLHLKPTNVYEESFALRKVVNEIEHEHVIIMGNMNFDCKYMAGYKREDFRQTFPDFTFYINDDQSTTTSKTSCAYDRILINNNGLQNQVVPNSNQTNIYYPRLNLTSTEADKISDHYPVEIKFAL